MSMGYIKRFLHKCNEGQLFTTREVLQYGTRAAVDQALQRLVKEGIIIRLARGVFIKYYIGFKWPSVFEVATAKAKAFQKQIIISGKDAAKALKVIPTTNQQGNNQYENSQNVVYSTDGSTSAFHYKDTKIIFKATSARQMSLGESRLGLAIRAIWYVGKVCTPEQVENAVRNLNRVELLEFRCLASIMPFWFRPLFRWNWCRSV
jgi:hypothetical protein